MELDQLDARPLGLRFDPAEHGGILALGRARGERRGVEAESLGEQPEGPRPLPEFEVHQPGGFELLLLQEGAAKVEHHGANMGICGNNCTPAVIFGGMDKRIHDEPSEVSAAEGTVVVDGPDGVAVTLTPDAAAETASRLEDKSAVARDQAQADEPTE